MSILSLQLLHVNSFVSIPSTLFTPLRVGWPPTPQVFFGLWQGLRVVLNMRTGFVGMPASPWRKIGSTRAINDCKTVHGAIATADMQPVPARFFFHKIIQILCFLKCVWMFLQRFPSKHGNLHICRHKTVPKLIFTMFPIILSPKPLKTLLFTLCSSIFPCWPTQTYIQKIIQKHSFFRCFYMFFRQKHRNLHVFRHKVGPKHWFLQCFQGSGIKKRSIPWFPQTLEDTAIYTVFFNLSMCQCRWPTQTYIQKIIQKHSFFRCFYIFFRQKHRNLHVFRLKVGPKHWFLQCFQCSGIQNHSKYRCLQGLSFLSVKPLPEADQNDPKFRFNGLLSSDTQKSSNKFADTTNTRSRSFLPRPPPAKADIATAILTNVIKHLV